MGMFIINGTLCTVRHRFISVEQRYSDDIMHRLVLVPFLYSELSLFSNLINDIICVHQRMAEIILDCR